MKAKVKDWEKKLRDLKCSPSSPLQKRSPSFFHQSFAFALNFAITCFLRSFAVALGRTIYTCSTRRRQHGEARDGKDGGTGELTCLWIWQSCSDSIRQHPTASDSIRQSDSPTGPTVSDNVRQVGSVESVRQSDSVRQASPTESDRVRQSDSPTVRQCPTESDSPTEESDRSDSSDSHGSSI